MTPTSKPLTPNAGRVAIHRLQAFVVSVDSEVIVVAIQFTLEHSVLHLDR